MHHTDSPACTHERPSLAPPCMHQSPPTRAAPMHLLALAHAAASDDDDCRRRRRRPQANGGAAVRTRRSTPSRSCSRCQAAPSASTPPRHPPRSWSAPPAWRVRPKRRTPPHTAAHRRPHPTLWGASASIVHLQCIYSASTVRAWCMAWLALLSYRHRPGLSSQDLAACGLSLALAPTLARPLHCMKTPPSRVRTAERRPHRTTAASLLPRRQNAARCAADAPPLLPAVAATFVTAAVTPSRHFRRAETGRLGCGLRPLPALRLPSGLRHC